VVYTRFRQVLRRYAHTARAFDGHAAPDFLEEPPSRHAALIELLDATRRRMRGLLRHFPKVPPGGFGEDGAEFGPVVHADDLRVAASVQLPLALALGDDFPTESYGPVALLREKCVLLTSTIEVYAGWRAYKLGQYRTKWNGFPRQIPPEAVPGLTLVSPKDRHLARLFANVTASAASCRRAVESQLGRSADVI
jgi:hypothetical protein